MNLALGHSAHPSYEGGRLAVDEVGAAIATETVAVSTHAQCEKLSIFSELQTATKCVDDNYQKGSHRASKSN